jgi:hypothetical protein
MIVLQGFGVLGVAAVQDFLAAATARKKANAPRRQGRCWLRLPPGHRREAAGADRPKPFARTHPTPHPRRPP